MSHRLLLFALLSAAPALAFPQVSANLGVSSEIFSARSYDLVADDDAMPMVRVGGSMVFAVPRGLLDVELAYHGGATGGVAHGNVTGRLALQGLELGATWRYPLWRFLQPYAHLGLGWDWATLTLFGPDRLRQTVSNIGGRGLLGIQVPLRLTDGEAHAPTLLADLGLGYVLRPGFGFHALAAPPPDKTKIDPIARAPVDLGTMPLSGITFRVLLGFRY